MNEKQIEKECSRCHDSFPVAHYKPCKSTKDRLQVWCNTCRRAYALARYNKNKDSDNERRREHYKQNKIK